MGGRVDGRWVMAIVGKGEKSQSKLPRMTKTRRHSHNLILSNLLRDGAVKVKLIYGDATRISRSTGAITRTRSMRIIQQQGRNRLNEH